MENINILYIILLSAIGYIAGHYFRMIIPKLRILFKKKKAPVVLYDFISKESIKQIEEYQIQIQSLEKQYSKLSGEYTITKTL